MPDSGNHSSYKHLQNDTEHKDTKHNASQNNDIQHNNKKMRHSAYMTLNIMTQNDNQYERHCCYASCLYAVYIIFYTERK